MFYAPIIPMFDENITNIDDSDVIYNNLYVEH